MRAGVRMSRPGLVIPFSRFGVHEIEPPIESTKEYILLQGPGAPPRFRDFLTIKPSRFDGPTFAIRSSSKRGPDWVRKRMYSFARPRGAAPLSRFLTHQSFPVWWSPFSRLGVHQNGPRIEAAKGYTLLRGPEG